MMTTKTLMIWGKWWGCCEVDLMRELVTLSSKVVLMRRFATLPYTDRGLSIKVV